LGTGLEEFLVQALSAPEARIRTAATNALANLRACNKAPQIAKLLDDSDPKVRFAAVGALGELRASAGLILLYRLMVGEDPGLRSAAAQTLSRMPGAVSMLEQAARDPSPAIREVAQAALVSRHVINADSEE
jgi:hypothetical protein